MPINVTLFRGTLFVIHDTEVGVNDQNLWATQPMDSKDSQIPEMVIVAKLRDSYVNENYAGDTATAFKALAKILRAFYPEMVPYTQRTNIRQRQIGQVTREERTQNLLTIYRMLAGSAIAFIDGEVIELQRLSSLKEKKGKERVRMVQLKNKDIRSFFAGAAAIRGDLQSVLNDFHKGMHSNQHRQMLAEYIGRLAVHTDPELNKAINEGRAKIGVYNVGGQITSREELEQPMWL